jgi:hypothetical protein
MRISKVPKKELKKGLKQEKPAKAKVGQADEIFGVYLGRFSLNRVSV